MNGVTSVFLAICLLCGSSQGIDEFTQRISAELRAQSPSAAEQFELANAARERSELAEAERLYRAVLVEAPEFVHAKRRLSGVIGAQGRRQEALALARETCRQDPGAENHANLLGLLINAEALVPAESAEALALTRKVVNDKGASSAALLSAAQAAVVLQDLPLLQQSVGRLRQAAPEHHLTHYFACLAAMTVGDRDGAAAELAEAHRLGLADETHAELLAALEASRPVHERFLEPAAWILGAWAALFLSLLGMGVVLSRAALRAAARAPEQASGEFTGLDRKLRQAYRLVLWLSCAFYYLSLPLVLVSVVGLGGAIVYGFWELGRIPIKLVLIVVVVVLVTVWSMLKSLVIFGRDEDPGEWLDLEGQPRLRALLDEVAEAIGTRPVDSVYLTPGTEVAVFERGGLWRQLQGKTERCLILGIGVLDGFQLGPLRAVLAHEYGHFQNRDTAGGGLALAVRRSLFTMAQGLALGGAAAPYNPAWLFLNGFHRVFMRISQGASRLQEVMADRWAAFAYGATNFEQGLRHVIERSVRFDVAANRKFQLAHEKNEPLTNLYEPQPIPAELEGKIEEHVQKAIDAEPSPYDSHPSPRDRFAWVAALEAPLEPTSDATQPAWGLFDGRAELEQQMTELVLSNAQAAGEAVAERRSQRKSKRRRR